ncbi:MAG: hypothetical protein KDA80_09480 [Planctomycetaceae bacterium]|nr:hypothetical protein [Planctomycetaceae bacterium]
MNSFSIFDTTNRREFLQFVAAATITGLAGTANLATAKEWKVHGRGHKKRPRIAAIYTELREFSHAYHILEAHMGPYLFNGQLTDPGVDVVSYYADQFPDGDMTREAVQRLKMPLYDSIAEALTCGGKELAVDGVLLIGEHGTYPKSPLGQVMYPRKEFFDQIVAVMDQSQRYVPVFNDKHLSWRWDWAKEMYDTAQDRGFALMAGSSVPLAQRIPDLEFPNGAEVSGAVSIHGGPIESYDFHGLEVLESFIEARKGGEAGIMSVQLLEGPEMLEAGNVGKWRTDLAIAAMQAELDQDYDEITLDGDYPLKHGLLLEHADGLRSAVLSVGNSGTRWNFACEIAGRDVPFALKIYPGPWGNRNLFRALSHSIQELFLTGKSPYPVERTLLATGVLDAAMHSHAEDGALVITPHLKLPYQPINFDHLRERGDSWKILKPGSPRPEKFEPGDLPTLERIVEGE